MVNSNELEVGNFIKNNDVAGVAVTESSLNNRISRTQISDNRLLGIDLEYDGVTANDNGDGDVGSNSLLNFPITIIDTVILLGNNLKIAGFAPAGSVVEFFIADAGPNPNPLLISFTTSFGEGAVYLFAQTEWGVNDADATTGTYTDDGTRATITKSQNRFEFTFDVSSFSLDNATRFTSTATDISNNTSEFSGVTNIYH